MSDGRPHLSVVLDAPVLHVMDDAAERSAIGAVFIRPSVFPTIGLDAEHFQNPRNRWVWEAMTAAADAGHAIDETVIEGELQRTGKLEAIGGLSYIGDLAAEVPTADNVHTYADRVRAAHGRRRTIEELAEALEAAKRGDEQADVRAHIVAADAALESASGPRYGSAPARLVGDKAKRIAAGKRLQSYRVPFLDDYLRGISPGDLTLIGARTGCGKTEIARMIAQANAAAGRRVYMLALEAQENEIERRIMYNKLADFAFSCTKHGNPYLDQDERERMNYLDWSLGRLDDIVGEYEPEIEGLIRQKLPTLHTLYRERDFGVDDLAQRLAELQGKADLVILDHLHYVDSKDPNENRAAKEIMQVIRSANLKTGVPAIVIAHLRKKDRGRASLVPDLDDFHGSSEITKIATAAVMVSRATDNPNASPWIANTYFTIPKMRAGGACPYVAMVGYDMRRNEYEKGYELGRLNFDGSAVELMDAKDYPRWVGATERARAQALK